MKQLVSLLLIPMIVLGQAMPHSHAGTGVAESDDHASRPHLHLSIGHSHHHDADHADHEHDHGTIKTEADDFASSGYSLPIEHDSDAIYLAQHIASHIRSVAKHHVDTGDCVFAETLDWNHRTYSPKVLSSVTPDRYAATAERYAATAERYAGPPIYLLVASLRI